MDLDLGRQSIANWAESAPEEADTDFIPAQDRFLVEAPIGSGGMGEVFLVTDLDLRRQVAMKMIRTHTAIGRDQRLQFIAEAQATSQLEHPGIPPVHDLGLTRDGRLYFTMKLVQGRTFREVLHDLLLKRREVHREYGLHRLITILERICEPLHFSHEKGVIHRDLKPENIMLGDYGEVHVLDWGLARIAESTAEFPEIGTVETARRDAGLETQQGAVKGTPAYMSPEQILGEPLDRRSDVYALGCLLYEILTLHSAFDPKDKELVAKKQSGQVADVKTVNSRRHVPEPLAAICRKAMATQPQKRYATAEDLANDLWRWLDGRAERERRHQEAEKLVKQSRTAAEQYGQRQEKLKIAEAEAESEAFKFKPYQPVSEKRTLLEARTRVEDLKVTIALAFAEAVKHLEAALIQEPENATAKAALVSLWKDRLAEAEHRRDNAGVAYALAVIERYASEPLSSEGTLTLASDPPGADVRLYRYEEIDGVLEPSDERHLGRTPLAAMTLAMGRYLCILKKDGFRETRYPVHITRQRVWSCSVQLRTDEEIGEGFVHVSKGPFVYGEGEKTTTKEQPDFAIQKYPVTFAQFAEFLQTLDDEEAQKRTPQTLGESPYMEKHADGKYLMLPILVEGDAREWSLKQYGEGFEMRLPVIGISYEDAVAYCDWKSRTTGKEWRLPTEEEREKATRGVDGRRFPWGDLEDASLGKCRESREVNAQPEPVGSFRTAESVYGMGDASGGVWDWTSSWEDERRSSRVLCGGSWHHRTPNMRAACRIAVSPLARLTVVGFRCARTL